MVPPLTTIEVPTADIGKAAVDRMLQIIKDKDTSIRRILFPTKLIERKSLK
jgi:LacI family transcriptional regulator/LacI family repressor for deo operon, udp, cdd, tsx, nupC, and nupG